MRYIEAMHRQSLKSFRVTQQEMRRALNHMVLNDRVMSQIGPAVNSGRSIFLYGPPGDGKTTIAEAVGRMILTTDLLVPYAIEVDGTVIKIFDEANHQRSETQTGAIKNRDPRWVKIQRPVIVTGGELTLETLDLVWDDVRKYYEAPYQMKANGGMFLIDDFGRQQVRPRDLLNRWIVPLEKRVDYLTLHTGRKIEIPFDVLIVFSTNLAPRDLVDEAFLRRIRHKIDIGDPNFEEYSEIFKRVATAKKMQYRRSGTGLPDSGILHQAAPPLARRASARPHRADGRHRPVLERADGHHQRIDRSGLRGVFRGVVSVRTDRNRVSPFCMELND